MNTSVYVRVVLSFIGIMLAGVLFELWTPSYHSIKRADYTHVELSLEEQLSAIDQAKRWKYMNEMGYTNNYFPYSSYPTKMATDTYLWFIINKVIMLWLVGIILWFTHMLNFYSPARANAILYPTLGYFCLQVIDFIDWFFTYNREYYSIATPWVEVPISWNIVSFLIYGIFVIYVHARNGGIDGSDTGFSGFGSTIGHY